MSQQNINLNSANAEPFDLLSDQQMLLFKLLVSTDNVPEHLDGTASLSSNNEQQISRSINDINTREHSIVDNHQLPSSKDSNDGLVRINTNSMTLNKKVTRIKHYPNMLADFD
jgi:hypothetical protein